MAKMFNSKFTHLSPVWYDLKRYVHLIPIIDLALTVLVLRLSLDFLNA